PRGDRDAVPSSDPHGAVERTADRQRRRSEPRPRACARLLERSLGLRLRRSHRHRTRLDDGRRRLDAGGRCCGGDTRLLRAAAARVYCYAADFGWYVAATLSPLREKSEVHTELPALIESIARTAQSGDHVLVMSNGGFGGIHEKLLARLAM